MKKINTNSNNNPNNKNLFENRRIKANSKLNLTNNIFKNIIEQIEIRNENEEKKGIIVKKQNNKKNNINKKLIGDQIKKIIYNQNIIKERMNKITKNSKPKSRNINSGFIKEINSSYNIRSNKNIKCGNNNIILNTSRDKNNEMFKTSIKTIFDKKKIQNIKQSINNYNENNKNKMVKYNLILNHIPINKERMKNKTLNINIINNTCIYIKPKQSKFWIKNKSRNSLKK